MPAGSRTYDSGAGQVARTGSKTCPGWAVMPRGSREGAIVSMNSPVADSGFIIQRPCHRRHPVLAAFMQPGIVVGQGVAVALSTDRKESDPSDRVPPDNGLARF